MSQRSRMDTTTIRAAVNPAQQVAANQATAEALETIWTLLSRVVDTRAGELAVQQIDATKVKASSLHLDQGYADGNLVETMSDDIAHGMTGRDKTNIWLSLRKWVPTSGGAWWRGYSEDEVGIGIDGFITNDVTAKTNGATNGAVVVDGRKKSGTGAGAMGANANVFVVQDNYSTRFIVDKEGDYHYDGADGGAFDEYDDAQMVRALSLASGKGVVKSKWDELVEYNEDSLIEAGILGAPVAEGGLVNGAQLQRLLVGATWQMFTQLQEANEKIEALEQKLLDGD